MEKQTLIARLNALPVEIAAAEEGVIQAQMTLLHARDNLQRKEDGLLLGRYVEEGMVIDGKNEAIRSAQLRQFTWHEREALGDAEMSLNTAKNQLSALQYEFRALQAVAHLLSGEVA